MLVPDECIDRWEFIRQHLDKALVHSQGEWSANDILKKVLSDSKSFHIWEVTQDDKVVAIATTRIVYYNHYDVLRIFTLANVGDAKWTDYQEDALDKIAQVAKEVGLKRLEFIGRQGWERRLKDWNLLHVTMGMEL